MTKSVDKNKPDVNLCKILAEAGKEGATRVKHKLDS